MSHLSTEMSFNNFQKHKDDYELDILSYDKSLYYNKFKLNKMIIDDLYNHNLINLEFYENQLDIYKYIYQQEDPFIKYCNLISMTLFICIIYFFINYIQTMYSIH